MRVSRSGVGIFAVYFTRTASGRRSSSGIERLGRFVTRHDNLLPAVMQALNVWKILPGGFLPLMNWISSKFSKTSTVPISGRELIRRAIADQVLDHLCSMKRSEVV